jgi:hypothetical protein
VITNQQASGRIPRHREGGHAIVSAWLEKAVRHLISRTREHDIRQPRSQIEEAIRIWDQPKA